MGIGIIIATIFISGAKLKYTMSDYEVEKRALKMGMKYPQDVKVINKEELKK